jgi:plastocyanin
MPIMLKRLSPLVVLLVGLGFLVVSTFEDAGARVTRSVDIVGYSYSPRNITVAQGSTVTWTNTNTTTPHTATGKPKFWDSHDIAFGGGQFSETNTFLNAGTYTYFCTIHTFIAPGSVAVPLIATGTAANGYTLTWSSLPAAPTDRSFDVQIKRPSSTTWASFKTKTTARHTFFNPSRTGKYSFRARTNIVPGTKHSGWSPIITFSIS